MKRYILPAATALAGFAIAWAVKPAEQSAAAAPASGTPQARAATQRGASVLPAGKRPKEVNAGDFPLADALADAPKSREEAKMLRLSEALGLTVDQQGSIIRVVEDAQATLNGNVPVFEDLASRGQLVQQGLETTLSPEQLAKFQEIQERERDNLIEARAQRLLTGAISDIDLSPDQREAVLARLRQKARMDIQGIPAVAALLFDKSLLPVGDKELSVEGLLQLSKMGEEVVFEDPMVAHQKVVDTQKRELEDILRCFDGILTPGQMGQFQATVNEERAALLRLPAQVVQDIPPVPDDAPDDE